jgi:hypothetical protein
MTRRRAIALLGGVLLLAVALAPVASAGKPTIERMVIDVTFADDFLTEACGVPVTTNIQGRITTRSFPGGGTGPAEITTVNLVATATAGDNVFQARDVGADHVQIKPDGTEILMVIGQVPLGFTGVLKINLTTGEVIHEPSHDTSGELEEVCAALTA